MTKTRRLIPVLLLLIYNVTVHADSDLSDAYLWKVEWPRDVTQNTRYGWEVTPAELLRRELHDLWAKAGAEDASGIAPLITMDLLAIPKDFSDELRGWVRQSMALICADHLSMSIRILVR